MLVSVVKLVELPHKASRRALRREVLRESARRMLSRKSTGKAVSVDALRREHRRGNASVDRNLPVTKHNTTMAIVQ